ncbi:MAG: hypothetical protein KIT10_06645 [Flavobacteriales bacterium]|nr:hypothetical protein [Flavobacteriales bacterium]
MTRTATLLLLLAALQGMAQQATRVEIIGADEWRFDERIAPGAQRLKGNVRFRHDRALMWCDSAYLYNDQRVEAFGHVRIDQGDSLRMRGDRLSYDGQQRIARMEGRVSLEDGRMRLEAPSLEHDLRSRRATYHEGAVITGQEGDVLTSQRGTYLTGEKLFLFSRDVRITHPERIITGDTLHYGMATGVAEFFGPTTILLTGDSTIIRTRRGTYDTKNDQARSTRRSSVEHRGRSLAGDTLHYDKATGIGLAWGNVAITDTAGKITSSGQHGRYNERTDRSMITGRALLVMAMEDDSLHLHGDTLFTAPQQVTDSAGGTVTHRHVLAYRQVRFHKRDMQGTCDTLTYSGADSLIRMFHRPVLWSGTDQISGGHIRITLRDGRAHRMYVEQDAFLVSRLDSTRYDQVAGRQMTGFFDEDGLRRLVAEGNSRTVFHVREQKDGEEENIGVNVAECGRIAVELADGEVAVVTFLDRPDAVLHPTEKLPEDAAILEGMVWRERERPVDRADIFRKP